MTALVTFLVYLPALWNGFVEWDDQAYVYENPGIRSFGFDFLKSAFTSVLNSNWHPLTVISYGIDYQLWGLDPFGYHLVNIIFHALNTFLVFVLGAALAKKALEKSAGTYLRPLVIGFTAALLFGVHPLHVESVAWVSERKDVLSGFFFLLSILAYLRYSGAEKAERGPRGVFYLSALFFFALALLSKPMAITLPIVLLVLDFYPLGRLSRDLAFKAVAEKVPFCALGAASAALTVWAQRSEAMASLEVSPLIERVSVAAQGFVFYLYKMAVPTDLAPFYVRPLKGEFFDTAFFVSLGILAAVSAVSVLAVKKHRYLTAGWLYYIITLLPVIGIVQVSDHAAADRYAYLPSIGPFLLAGGATAYFFKDPLKKAYAGAAGLGAFAILAVFTVMTVKQIAVWKDTASLWTQEIKVFPVVQAYKKRADAFEKQGKLKEAIEDYTVVINNTGEGLEYLYSRRGGIYLKAGEYAAAIDDFNKAIIMSVGNAAAYNNRGNAYKMSGNYQQAIADYTKAAELSPATPAFHFNLGAAYLDSGATELARMSLKRASELGLREADIVLESRALD